MIFFMKESKKNYRIIIQYDGTRYRGWQGQKDTAETIQGKIENVLTRMAGDPVEVIGSGRTDAGVHAIHQVANFYLPGDYSEQEILSYLNQYLPEDIAVSAVQRVPERFHSRYQAKSKTYRYIIHTGEVPDVFRRKYVYDYRMPLSVDAMRKAADKLVGTHDFKAFCGNKKMKKSTVRTIFSIDIAESADEICIYYTGDGFLQNMVRILTGTLIEIGDGRRAPEEITEILASGNREMAGYTAPACGLTLFMVEYED